MSHLSAANKANMTSALGTISPDQYREIVDLLTPIFSASAPSVNPSAACFFFSNAAVEAQIVNFFFMSLGFISREDKLLIDHQGC